MGLAPGSPGRASSENSTVQFRSILLTLPAMLNNAAIVQTCCVHCQRAEECGHKNETCWQQWIHQMSKLIIKFDVSNIAAVIGGLQGQAVK